MFLSSPTLAALRYFEAAARHLSFKQAAAELHVTHGAVSQQIKQLEEALGCKLFYRLPRQIQLTNEGAKFAVVVRQALNQIEQEAQSIKLSHGQDEIRVRVGPSFAMRWLVPRLDDFYREHPDTKLFITAEYGFIDPAARKFDLSIDLSTGEYSALHTEALMPEYLTPVCTPNYLDEHDFLKTPADLFNCTLLHDAHAWLGEDKDAEWKFWLTQAGATEVDSNQGLFFTLADMAIEAALNNQGIAMGRASLIERLVSDGTLVSPFPNKFESPYAYFIAYPNELAQLPRLRCFVEWLHVQAQGNYC